MKQTAGHRKQTFASLFVNVKWYESMKKVQFCI
jgi:hypothetical protein